MYERQRRMTCKDCIHSGLCYKENDYENFPDRCGSFISNKVLEERPKGEWIRSVHWDGTVSWYCSECGKKNEHGITIEKFCYKCGADMRKPNCVTCDKFGKDCGKCERGDEE